MKYMLLIIIFIHTSKLIGNDSIFFRVFFDYDSFSLDSNQQKRLISFINFNFQNHKIENVIIEAYCDEIGSNKYNNLLSIKRAEIVKKLINEYKIDSPKIFANGKGSFKEINNNNTEKRRAEITFFYSKILNKKIEKNNLNLKDFFNSAKTGHKIELNIKFLPGRSKFTNETYSELKKLISELEKTNLKIEIQGHVYLNGIKNYSDGYDEDTKKNDLSINRAKAVYNYLINSNIDKKRLKFKGLGGRYPKGKTPEEDRRVEIEVI